MDCQIASGPAAGDGAQTTAVESEFLKTICELKPTPALLTLPHWLVGLQLCHPTALVAVCILLLGATGAAARVTGPDQPDLQPTAPLSLRPEPSASSWQQIITNKLPPVEEQLLPERRLAYRPLYVADQPPWPTATGLAFRYPIDLGYQGRAVPQFCPGYLPKQYPGKSLDEFCYQSYTTSPWLEQYGWANPFKIAQEETQLWQDEKSVRWQRAALAAAYAWQNRGADRLADDLLRAVLGRQWILSRELMVDVITPTVMGALPEQITMVTSGPGETAIDLRVETNTSFDSATGTEDLLLTAARRGLDAVVVADRNRLDGAQRTQRIAAHLKAQGRLPSDFAVIVGEQIQTLSGGVLGLFLRWRVPEGMTMKKTLAAIHKQGGLAVLVHPGAPGGPRLLREMPFDGYLLQPGLFDMFRTLNILYDPALADIPVLFASNSRYAAAVGLPYTIIETDDTRPAGLKEALAAGRAYPASGLYLPWMAAISIKPVGKLESILNRFFVWHDAVEGKLCDFLRADNVAVSTTWDRELQGWMGLDRLPRGIHMIGNRTSPLLELPHLTKLSVEYSYFQLQYNRQGRKLILRARGIW